MGYYTTVDLHMTVENREIDGLLRVLIDGVPGNDCGVVSDLSERARQALREHPGLPHARDLDGDGLRRLQGRHPGRLGGQGLTSGVGDGSLVWRPVLDRTER